MDLKWAVQGIATESEWLEICWTKSKLRGLSLQTERWLWKPNLKSAPDLRQVEAWKCASKYFEFRLLYKVYQSSLNPCKIYFWNQNPLAVLGGLASRRTRSSGQARLLSACGGVRWRLMWDQQHNNSGSLALKLCYLYGSCLGFFHS